MEPLTAGAIALVALLGNKALDKGSDKFIDVVFEKSAQVFKLLKHKSPDTVTAIERVQQNPQLAEQQPENYGQAVLVERIKQQAVADPEIRAAVEEFGQVANSQPKLSRVIENWKGINIKGGINTINNPTFNY